MGTVFWMIVGIVLMFASILSLFVERWGTAGFFFGASIIALLLSYALRNK